MPEPSSLTLTLPNGIVLGGIDAVNASVTATLLEYLRWCNLLRPAPIYRGSFYIVTRLIFASLIVAFFAKVKEEWDIVPAKVRVLEYMQEKAVFEQDEDSQKRVAAALPKHLIKGAMGSVGLIAHASAVCYSIVESAKHNGLEPYQYIHDLLTHLPYA